MQTVKCPFSQNKKMSRHREAGSPPIEAIYDVEDAYEAVKQMISVPLHRPLPIAPGVTLQFFDSGHVLGSALVVLDHEHKGERRRLLFIGDLGREQLPLLRKLALVHGGVDARETLARSIEERLSLEVVRGVKGEQLKL